MKWMTVTYGFSGTARFEHFATQGEALAHMKEEAQDYLNSGDNPPMLDDWFVAQVTHSIQLTQRPFEHTGVRISE